jgi:hypothetical protein
MYAGAGGACVFLRAKCTILRVGKFHEDKKQTDHFFFYGYFYPYYFVIRGIVCSPEGADQRD